MWPAERLRDVDPLCGTLPLASWPAPSQATRAQASGAERPAPPGAEWEPCPLCHPQPCIQPAQ